MLPRSGGDITAPQARFLLHFTQHKVIFIKKNHHFLFRMPKISGACGAGIKYIVYLILELNIYTFNSIFNSQNN